MRRRATVATIAALVILLAVALPVAADSEYAGAVHSIDWRLVVILVALALFAFYAVLEVVNRGR